MVYLSMDKEFVDKNLKKWNEEAISGMGEDGKNKYIFSDNEEGRIEEFEEDKSKIMVAIDSSELGYISFEVKLDTEDLLSLIEMAVKKLNKFKSVLESLK